MRTTNKAANAPAALTPEQQQQILSLLNQHGYNAFMLMQLMEYTGKLNAPDFVHLLDRLLQDYIDSVDHLTDEPLTAYAQLMRFKNTLRSFAGHW